MTKLTGETNGRPLGERVPINIDADVRESLRNLLFAPEMRGVGWSEFIQRAVDRAWEELGALSNPCAEIETDLDYKHRLQNAEDEIAHLRLSRDHWRKIAIQMGSGDENPTLVDELLGERDSYAARHGLGGEV